MLAEEIMEIINTNYSDKYAMSLITNACKQDIFERARKEHCTPSRLKTIKGIEHAMKSIRNKNREAWEKAYILKDGRIAWTNIHVLILADPEYADEIHKEYIWQPEEIEQENIGDFLDITGLENMEYKYKGVIEVDKVKAVKAFWKGKKGMHFMPIVINYKDDKKVAWYNLKYIDAICKIYNEPEIHFMAADNLVMLVDKNGVKVIDTPVRVDKDDEVVGKLLKYFDL